MAAQLNESPRTKNKFSFIRYVKETKQELKRVTWPTKKELLKNTGVVLTVVVSATILVWALDSVLSGALNLILK
ncbi:preprotein translocase subunit SecE [[Clostridium] sordellii]|uniref:Protein translocase subunit SecE n=1 Tax=Paraclostridium sordellii TaxID=1505 RepID=A0A0A1RVL4_PARSO|nr:MULTISPECIES: preprotein translocase subunit SecE [Paeniclostridium]EPZ61439.1 preprotein translocase, SecE subunit [[Clostridium] sordellii ATCC 9714] [Paeniclostridium sordellii ATCC 9714]MDU5021572.1 preprotein translocase subunit SecE [Clostridiales bacterium]MTM09226.1 preprotein translocase subunit SecE [Turicibacter sanguinis]AUN12841.1 preprotein translocase subunit SecE [Paeniclostridium sordellii]EPZ61376.1 preprotein translocase, SecE subunit [[Clostridium] sordellii VPI 9048] [P